jgi:phytanoyl-CoA hydroxylase
MGETEQRVSFDNYENDGGYTPDLYDFHEIDEGIENLESVSDADIAAYHQNGYLAVKQGITGDELADVKAGMMHLISGGNPEFKGVQFEGSYRDRLQELTDEERWDAVRKLQHFVGYDDRLSALAEHPGLKGVIGRIIGEEPALFSHQAILKAPRVGREKPWHQDHAYFNLPLGTQIVSVWLSLDYATPENGCMRVIPVTHKEGPVVHFKRRDWQICDTDVVRNRVVAIQLPPGGCLFWSGMIHHGTPENNTDARRRAIQLHYYPASVERTSSEERLAIFGSEGKDVTC